MVGINSRNSVNTGPAASPSVGHSRMPPPQQGVYKGDRHQVGLVFAQALIRPVLEYPVIPNALASKKQLIRMQRIQNQSMRFIARNTEDRSKAMEQLHKHYNIEPINVRLYRQARKL